MMHPTPRIIAVDDNEKDLQALTKRLNQLGIACLPVHFTGEMEGIQSCHNVRVIFADLHLNESGASTDHTQHFGTIGGLIEEIIRPTGPYVLILWTRYSDEAKNLRRFLDERLDNSTKPLLVKAIDKMLHLNSEGNVNNSQKLIKEINQLFEQQPQIAALLDWEERVLDATANTVSSIFDLAEEPDRIKKVGSLLAQLAVGTVGEKHVEQDRFQAVNEALLPILTDHITEIRSGNKNEDIWRKAFNASDVKDSLHWKTAAKLNRLIHIAAPAGNKNDGTRRGAVIPLPEGLSGEKFEHQFNLEQQGESTSKQFHYKNTAEIDRQQLRWVLVQCQAACDYAQNQPGPLPYYLGIELPYASAKSGTCPAALWRSPSFISGDKNSVLHVNARFHISLSSTEVKETSLYRLREQLLNDLIYHIHGYGSRPGMLSFRGKKGR